jgi:hypothetical protein
MLSGVVFSWWPACLRELCSRSLQPCQFEFVSWRPSELVRSYVKGLGGSRGIKACQSGGRQSRGRCGFSGFSPDSSFPPYVQFPAPFALLRDPPSPC